MSEYINRPSQDPKKMEAQLEELRNKVSSKVTKWADRIQVSMAFTPKIERREGERWTEDGKEFIMKNGVKTSHGGLESIRMPFWCPRCKVAMNHRFDRKFWSLRGWCYNCNIDIEHEMRMDGTWPAFERHVTRQNQKAFLRDQIEQRMAYLKEFKGFENHFQDGRWEMMATREDFAPMLGMVEEDIEAMIAQLEHITREEQEEEANGQKLTPPDIKEVAQRLEDSRARNVGG